MTDPFFGPLVEALENISENKSSHSFRAVCERQRGVAKQALASHDPAPVLRVLRAAVDESECCPCRFGGVCPNEAVCISIKALLENPAYREWLEGVE